MVQIGIRWLIGAALIAGAAFWWLHARTQRAERDAGLASARTLTEVFEKTRALEVAKLSGEAIALSKAEGCFGFCNPTQTTKAPYEVTYTLDLRGLTPGNYHWNGESRLMIVTVPEVVANRPNVDMGRAQVRQSGVWIGRGPSVELAQKGSKYLQMASAEAAKKPEHMIKAQASAREAVEALVRGPLQVAGLKGVRVVVQLPGEARPAGLDQERWDESRPMAEVLREARR